MDRRSTVILALCVLVSATAAAAPSPTELAKKHYDLGAAAYQKGDFPTAVREFSLAYELSEQPDILFNLARVETKMGHEQQAIDYLKRYLEKRPDAQDAPAVRAEIEARTRALEAAQRERAAQAEAAAARHTAEAATRQDRAGRAGIALVATGGVLLAVGISLNVVAAKRAEAVSAGAGMPVVWAGSSFESDERLGTSSAPLGIAFDVVGGAAALTGAGLLIWRATSAKAAR